MDHAGIILISAYGKKQPPSAALSGDGLTQPLHGSRVMGAIHIHTGNDLFHPAFPSHLQQAVLNTLSVQTGQKYSGSHHSQRGIINLIIRRICDAQKTILIITTIDGKINRILCFF